MKILHVIVSANPAGGGPIEGIVQQEKIFSQLGHKRDVLTLDSFSDLWVARTALSVMPLGLRKRLPAFLHRVLPWLRYGYSPHIVRWIHENVHKYDVVVVNGIWNYAAMAALRGLRGQNVPYFVFTHGMLDPWFKKAYPLKHLAKQIFWWFCEGPLLNGARGVLFTTEEERQLARLSFSPYHPREYVVGYGTGDVVGDKAAQIAAFRAAFPILNGRKFLLFLSRIHPKKGCDLLIEAFAKHAAHSPALDLVIAGPDQTGWCAKLQAQAKHLGIAHRIHWPGMLMGDAKWGAFHACEAFILPSHQENFGIVVAEAMACDKPVLITNKVNIWREVESAGAGLVADDTLQGVDSLLTHFAALSTQEREAMGKAGRKLFLERYEITQAVQNLITLFNDAIGEKSST